MAFGAGCGRSGHSSISHRADGAQMKETIRERARELGFDECRFTTADAPESAPEFQNWLTEGCHGEMARSEEHTSELQSHSDLVCRLLLEKKKTNLSMRITQRMERLHWRHAISSYHGRK